jgi:hypothetical protein
VSWTAAIRTLRLFTAFSGKPASLPFGPVIVIKSRLSTVLDDVDKNKTAVQVEQIQQIPQETLMAQPPDRGEE